jgi:hypothetical protein
MATSKMVAWSCELLVAAAWVRFELTEPLRGSAVFKTAAFNHSATTPGPESSSFPETYARPLA